LAQLLVGLYVALDFQPVHIRQYLSDHDKSWHPHLMWFVPGDAAKSWGANLPGSPILAADDAEDRMTIFLVWVGYWSDGTPA
jgi:hypothetical protein